MTSSGQGSARAGEGVGVVMTAALSEFASTRAQRLLLNKSYTIPTTLVPSQLAPTSLRHLRVWVDDLAVPEEVDVIPEVDLPDAALVAEKPL